VTADGALVARASELIDEDATFEARPAHPWVGRGALKLDHALTLWPVVVEGRVVLDIGASTGGFTQVCLARGAARVFAVDVGRDQLHPILKKDRRAVRLEGVDARALTQDLITSPPGLIICDASFIGLSKVLPAALGLAAEACDLISLVKPQFEVGPALVGKGGVVRDVAARQAALDGVTAWLGEAGWTVRDTTESPVAGGDGNVEWLLWAQQKGRPA